MTSASGARLESPPSGFRPVQVGTARRRRSESVEPPRWGSRAAAADPVSAGRPSRRTRRPPRLLPPDSVSTCAELLARAQGRNRYDRRGGGAASEGASAAPCGLARGVHAAISIFAFQVRNPALPTLPPGKIEIGRHGRNPMGSRGPGAGGEEPPSPPRRAKGRRAHLGKGPHRLGRGSHRDRGPTGVASRGGALPRRAG